MKKQMIGMQMNADFQDAMKLKKVFRRVSAQIGIP